MRSDIGNFRAVDQTVPVTFTDGDFKHERIVRAVVDAAGGYDAAATAARVDQVALGVAAKRAAGVFSPAPAED